jgi:hypothetical protein
MVEQLQIEITWHTEYLGDTEFGEPVQQIVTNGVFGHSGLLCRWYGDGIGDGRPCRPDKASRDH